MLSGLIEVPRSYDLCFKEKEKNEAHVSGWSGDTFMVVLSMSVGGKVQT